MAALACAGRGTRGADPYRRCSVVGEPDSREPILVQMALVDHFMCPGEPRLLLAVYDEFVLFREGPACAKVEGPILRRVFEPGERRRFMEDIDINPLLFQAESPVEFCPRCVGRQIDLIALRGANSRFRLAVIGADSGAEPEAKEQRQRDGALAAAALLRSLDRVRSSLSRSESQPWTEEALVFARMQRGDPAGPVARCAWPRGWRAPDPGIRLEPGDSVVVPLSSAPTREEFKAYSGRCSVTDLRGASFLVFEQRTFPGQVELGLPFAIALLPLCR